MYRYSFDKSDFKVGLLSLRTMRCSKAHRSSLVSPTLSERVIREYSPHHKVRTYKVPQCMPLVGIGTLPTPFSPASVPLPPETGGRGHTSLRVGGWGESQFRRGANTVVLFICTYFVLHTIPLILCLQVFCLHGSGVDTTERLVYKACRQQQLKRCRTNHFIWIQCKYSRSLLNTGGRNKQTNIN
jgi:hypothetical protein